jgi:hypothetical protein
MFAGIFVVITVVAVAVAVSQLSSSNSSLNPLSNNSTSFGKKPTTAPLTTVSPAPGGGGATTVPTAAPTVTGYQACNGLESLCDVRANLVLYAMLHNAVSSKQDGVTLLANQELQLETALEQGWRGINYDIGKCSEFATTNSSSTTSNSSSSTSAVRLVHGICGLGTRDPVEVLTHIVEFLQKRPNEVLLMPVEIDNMLDGGAVSLAEIYAVMQQVTGFTDLLYQHPGPGTPWPTLRELIAQNTRILFFQYNAAESCSDSGSTCPPGFHDWFVYAAETAFQFESVAAVENTTASCAITRGASGERDFFGINIFTEIPSKANCEQLNAATFVEKHLSACSKLNNNLRPSAVLVDYWNVGDVQSVVQQYNAKLIPAVVRQANVTMNVTGVVSEMTATEQPIFLSTCSAYFSSQLTNLTNVYCSKITYQRYIFRRSRRRLQTTEYLRVTVQVSGDDASGNASLTEAHLAAVVDASGDEFVKTLSVQDQFFSTVTNISALTNDTGTRP